MATPTNLEQSVKAQAANLDPAQREFVLAELDTFLWNKRRIEQIQKQLDEGVVDDDGLTDYKAEKAIVGERHQLVTESSALFGHIMKWLKDTAPEEKDELMEFYSESGV